MGSQKGSTLLVVLVAFLVISLLLLSMLQIAAVERKMSRNNTDLLQARQAVDGGIARTCEQTYQCLLPAADSRELPVSPVAAGEVSQGELDPAGQASYKILGHGVKLVDQGENYCEYKFACEGRSRGVTQNASVRVRYGFSKLYRVENGVSVFYGRNFTDHGKIIGYGPLNNASRL